MYNANSIIENHSQCVCSVISQAILLYSVNFGKLLNTMIQYHPSWTIPWRKKRLKQWKHIIWIRKATSRRFHCTHIWFNIIETKIALDFCFIRMLFIFRLNCNIFRIYIYIHTELITINESFFINDTQKKAKERNKIDENSSVWTVNIQAGS